MNIIQDQEDPNKRIIQKCVNGNLETWREIQSTTGEIAESGGNVTVETITITRTLLTTTTE